MAIPENIPLQVTSVISWHDSTTTYAFNGVISQTIAQLAFTFLKLVQSFLATPLNDRLLALLRSPGTHLQAFNVECT